MTEKELERFMEKVEKPNGEDGCWLWIGAKNCPYGYGRFAIGGTQKLAHVLMFKHVNGEIPTGMVVAHSCDNKPCVNPNHLELKTNGENQTDAYRRNVRTSKGGPRHTIPMTKEVVERMKEMRRSGKTYDSIAKVIGVSLSTAFRETRYE